MPENNPYPRAAMSRARNGCRDSRVEAMMMKTTHSASRMTGYMDSPNGYRYRQLLSTPVYG